MQVIFEDEHVRVVVIRTTNGEFRNYCYIVYDKQTRDGVLIDPSWEADKVNAQIYEHNIVLRHVLLTHHHYDHINLSDQLTYVNGSIAWISQEEATYYAISLKNFRTFDKGEIIRFGNQECHSLSTPGHTVGSTCYQINNFLFTGDTLFPEGCGVCTTRGGNPYKMFSSLQLIKSSMDKKMLIFQGHSYGADPGIALEEVFKINIYLQIEDEETFVKFRMRKNQKSFMEFH